MSFTCRLNLIQLHKDFTLNDEDRWQTLCLHIFNWSLHNLCPREGQSKICCKSSVLQWKALILLITNPEDSWYSASDDCFTAPSPKDTPTHTHVVPVLRMHLRVVFLLYIPRTSPASTTARLSSLCLRCTLKTGTALFPFSGQIAHLQRETEGGKKKGKGKNRKGEENQWMWMRRKGKERQIALIM